MNETQKASHWAFLTSAASETLLLFFLSSLCVAMSTFFFSFASFPGKTCPTKTKEERRSEWLCLAALEGFFRGSNIYRKNPLLAVLNFLEAWRRQKSGQALLFYVIAEMYARVCKVVSEVCTYTGQSKFPYLFSKRCIARSRKTGKITRHRIRTFFPAAVLLFCPPHFFPKHLPFLPHANTFEKFLPPLPLAIRSSRKSFSQWDWYRLRVGFFLPFFPHETFFSGAWESEF